MRTSFIAAVTCAILAAMTCPSATAIALQGTSHSSSTTSSIAPEGILKQKGHGKNTEPIWINEHANKVKEID